MTLNSFPLYKGCGRSFPAPSAGDANYLASCSPAAASGVARRFLCHWWGLDPLWRVGGCGQGSSRVSRASDAPAPPHLARGMAGGRGVTQGPRPPWEGPIFFPVPNPRTGSCCWAEELASGCVNRTDKRSFAHPWFSSSFLSLALPSPSAYDTLDKSLSPWGTPASSAPG